MNLQTLLALSGEDFVRATYRAVLGREPDQAGLQRYVMRMNLGHSKASVAHELLSSKEARARSARGLLDAAGLADEEFVAAAFQVLLGRAPDPAGQSHYLGLLKKTGSRKHVVKDIASSKEARARSQQVAAFRLGIRALLWKDRIRRGWRGWGRFGRSRTASGDTAAAHSVPEVLTSLPLQARLHYGRLQRIRQSLTSGER